MNIYTRKIAISPSTDLGVFPVSISSETPVQRNFSGQALNEILVHTPEAIDLSRAKDGLPLLESHNNFALPMGVIDGVRLENKRLVGTLRLGESQRAIEVAKDIRANVIKSLSIGYQIQDYDITGDVLKVTRWLPIETSLVSVPADASVGINRTLKIETMNTELETPVATETPEQTRIAEINELFGLSTVPKIKKFNDLRIRALAHGWTIDMARTELLRGLAEDSEPIAPLLLDRIEYSESRSVRTNDDFVDAATDALCIRAGIPLKNVHPAARDLSQMSMRDMLNTISSRQDKRGFFSSLRSRSGHTTSDFTNLLANISNKALMHLMSETQHPWKSWTRQIQVPDFKPQSLIGVGAFSDLEQIPESGEYSQGTVLDWSESVSVLTYGKNFGLTRQALINDDLGQFATLSRQFAASANRKIAQLAFEQLTANKKLAFDNTALFATAHANNAGTAATPSVATLDAATTAMRMQTSHVRKGDKSAPIYLNIQPKFLLVPVGLEMATRTILRSAWYPTDAGDVANPFYSVGANQIELIADPLLDANSATGWYLVADPAQFDCVVVASLSTTGNLFGLTVEEFQPDHRSDTFWQKIRIDCGAAAVDYRTCYRGGV